MLSVVPTHPASLRGTWKYKLLGVRQGDLAGGRCSSWSPPCSTEHVLQAAQLTYIDALQSPTLCINLNVATSRRADACTQIR